MNTSSAKIGSSEVLSFLYSSSNNKISLLGAHNYYQEPNKMVQLMTIVENRTLILELNWYKLPISRLKITIIHNGKWFHDHNDQPFSSLLVKYQFNWIIGNPRNHRKIIKSIFLWKAILLVENTWSKANFFSDHSAVPTRSKLKSGTCFRTRFICVSGVM